MSETIDYPRGRFFEDFAEGEILRHHRGKTIKESDAVTICNLVMNTAQGHFNDDMMKDFQIGQSIVYGGVTISMVIGLSADETAGNAIRELAMDNLRLLSPVVHGDTLYACTEVLDKVDGAAGNLIDGEQIAGLDERSGLIRFRHYGLNQHDKLVFQGDRTVLMAKRP